MIYDHFSDDIETAWCNNDVQKLIQRDRKDDKSITAQTCKDLDSQ
jgi:hypothetical protein